MSRTRRRIDRALARHQQRRDVDPVWVDRLRGCLGDPDADTRRGAVEALSEWGAGSAPAVPDLVAVLTATEGWIRGHALCALGRLGAVQALDAMRAELISGPLGGIGYVTEGLRGDAFAALAPTLAGLLDDAGDDRPPSPAGYTHDPARHASSVLRGLTALGSDLGVPWALRQLESPDGTSLARTAEHHLADLAPADRPAVRDVLRPRLTSSREPGRTGEAWVGAGGDPLEALPLLDRMVQREDRWAPTLAAVLGPCAGSRYDALAGLAGAWSPWGAAALVELAVRVDRSPDEVDALLVTGLDRAGDDAVRCLDLAAESGRLGAAVRDLLRERVTRTRRWDASFVTGGYVWRDELTVRRATEVLGATETLDPWHAPGS